MRSGLSLNTAIGQARDLATERLAAGFDQTALDSAARQGFANGSFEDAPDEAAEILEEFYPEESDALPTSSTEQANKHWTPAPQARPRNGTHSPSP